MLSDEQVASLMLEDLDEDPLLGLPVGQTIQASSRPPSALSKAAWSLTYLFYVDWFLLCKNFEPACVLRLTSSG